jgi:hypothetical protein
MASAFQKRGNADLPSRQSSEDDLVAPFRLSEPVPLKLLTIFKTSHANMTSKPHSIAILDDYQNVALKYGNWHPIEKYATITAFHDTLHAEDDLAARLASFTIICTMRERTKFKASLLKRLPNLKLLTTTGMRNLSIDIRAANAQGVVVAGTGGAGNATLEHIWALILGVMRHVAEEDGNTKEGGRVWQRTVPTGLKGSTLGLVGLGHLGKETARSATPRISRVDEQDCQSFRDGSYCVVTEFNS